MVNPSQTTVYRLAEDYKEFVRLIQNIISLYYVLDDRHVQGEEPFRKGELLNFSVELVLKNEDLSETINKVLKNCFKESADRIHFNIRKFQHTPISCYGIPEEYQLSQDTLKHFNKAFRQGISDNVFTGSIQIVK